MPTIVKCVDLPEVGKKTWMKMIYDPSTQKKVNKFVAAHKLKDSNGKPIRRFSLCAGIYVAGLQDGKPVRFVKISHDGSALYLSPKGANFGIGGAWNF